MLNDKLPASKPGRREILAFEMISGERVWLRMNELDSAAEKRHLQEPAGWRFPLPAIVLALVACSHRV
jgi:hypothetical protein